MVNKKIGNYYEKECCRLLAEKGYWVHLFAYNVNGQPCDVIAAKRGVSALIDVKHCSTLSFSFDNIRPNQHSSFAMAMEKDIKCGFAIYNDKVGWKWLDYVFVFLNKDCKSVKLKDLADLEQWL